MKSSVFEVVSRPVLVVFVMVVAVIIGGMGMRLLGGLDGGTTNDCVTVRGGMMEAGCKRDSARGEVPPSAKATRVAVCVVGLSPSAKECE